MNNQELNQYNKKKGGENAESEKRFSEAAAVMMSVRIGIIILTLIAVAAFVVYFMSGRAI